MNWFNNMKVGTKLTLSFTVILVLTAFLGIFSVTKMAQVNQTSTDMEVNWLPSTRLAGEITAGISGYRRNELQHILSTEEAEMAGYEKLLADGIAQIDKSRSAYEKLISSPEDRRLHDAFVKSWDEYLAESKKVVALSRDNKPDEAKMLIRGESKKQFDEATADLGKLVVLNIEGGANASRQGDELYASARLGIFMVLGLVVAIGAAIAVILTRGILRQLGGEPSYAAEVAGKIASGDLTVEVRVERGDTTSLLAAMKAMRDSLVNIVTQVRTGTDNIASASSQIATGNLDLSSRTEEQASSLEETASSMEELTSTVQQNAANARQANTLAASASDVAAKGGEAVNKVVDTMGAINASANKIVDIITVIDGIAFQTNILALNAAVEAARAGEQGRGFAVVAGEVRTLAQRAAAAAKEIKTLIDDSVDKVGAGTALVNDAGKTMEQIVESIKRVTDIMGEITSASQEQTSGIEQINQAVTQMDQVTQQNASLVEEAAAASEALKNQAAQLLQVVSVFKIGNAVAASTGASKPGRASSSTPARTSLAPVRAGGKSQPSAVIATRARAAKPKVEANGDEWDEF
ncbi:methyl-accepting chemotaxis protein [Noviherbaspirillum agri]